MNEYVVTVTFQLGEGYSHIINHFAIIDESMKSAKEYSKRLIPYGMDILNVSAHKVRENEEIPSAYYNWMYR